ncbi:hypothetical protein F4802DRAFT_594258 [Xylaria palmicola]|nr:hypothetical protein F4802DRAFT_594258 [Xylaria palmicola]
MSLYQTFEDHLQVQNEIWRDYRREGKHVVLSPEEIISIQERNSQIADQPLLDPGPLKFFENIKWNIMKYGNAPESSRFFNGQEESTDKRHVEGRIKYGLLLEFFGEPRYEAQRFLGMGGNGVAAHFKDRGDQGTDQPGLDFVAKIAEVDTENETWDSPGLVRERQMMRKVKGSAHCVQIFDPVDIGKPENDYALSLPPEDSSADDDSSGNESLTREQVTKRHRVRKRKSRSHAHWESKRRRKIDREASIERAFEEYLRKGQLKDYILMEYLPNGSLAGLIGRLNKNKRRDEDDLRIPNRVLWSFWLCLIRACIAMEYPPRKFHPHRKEPEDPSNNPKAVSNLRAKANKMFRECKRLGIELFNPGDYMSALSKYRQLEGDLIEKLPDQFGGSTSKQRWKLERRQNMIHRDLDPTNVFIGGFELGEAELLRWENTQKAASSTADSTNLNVLGELPKKDKDLRYTGKRPDRISQEHEIVPRLKELFGPEWETISPDGNGDELANSRTCGYYSNKTNIWAIALTMWQLITGLEPPLPPQPQAPYELVDQYPEYDRMGRTDRDDILLLEEYKDFRISYCPLLLDPASPEYHWAHKPLRETIFRCMYHKPDDRPSLQELLTEAEENVQLDFPGETDEYIREWINYWFYNPDLGVDPKTAPQHPPADAQQREERPQGHPPGGWHQLGPNPTINGVTYNINLPTDQDLIDIFQAAVAEFGDFIAEGTEYLLEEGNFGVDMLARILIDWGRAQGLELALGCILAGAEPVYLDSGVPNPRFIWIYNDNAGQLYEVEIEAHAARLANAYVAAHPDDRAQWQAVFEDERSRGLVESEGILNHYEGLQPSLPGQPTDSEETLHDFEFYEDDDDDNEDQDGDSDISEEE